MTELEVLQQINIQLQDNQQSIDNINESINQYTTTVGAIDIINEVQQIKTKVTQIETNTVILLSIIVLIFFFKKIKTFGGSFK